MELDDAEYQLKPMNCPFHILIYADKQHSYRDLPVRLGELGTVYRYERSGVLNGLFRVRGFTQDDAHIFCTTGPDRKRSGGVPAVRGRYAAPPTASTNTKQSFPRGTAARAASTTARPNSGNSARTRCSSACERLNIKAKVMPDEAAFYGPKIDVKLVDAIGRPWQLSTVQFDFTLPRRFNLEYIGEDGQKHQPLMVHRALYGSIERFFGILIEHYAGAFPVWLAPVQATVLPITDRQTEYARSVQKQLEEAGIRATVDERKREGEPENSRSATAENSVHAGGGRPRAAERPGGGAQPQAWRPGREIAGSLSRGHTRADRDQSCSGVIHVCDGGRDGTICRPPSGVSRRRLLPDDPRT